MTDEESIDAFFMLLADRSINHIIVSAGRIVFNGDMIVNNRTVNDLRGQMDAKFFNQVDVVLRGHSKMVDGGWLVCSIQWGASTTTWAWEHVLKRPDLNYRVTRLQER